MLDTMKQHEGWKVGKVDTKPSLANGGIVVGPTGGFDATLHGEEAVIPLKNGMVPVTLNTKVNAAYAPITTSVGAPDLAAKNTSKEEIEKQIADTKSRVNSDSAEMINTLKQSVEASQAMAAMMAEMIQQQKVSNSTQEKMLQHAQN
jgi:hypothetical protein